MRLLISTLCVVAFAATSGTAATLPSVTVNSTSASAGPGIDGTCSPGLGVQGSLSANFGGSGPSCNDSASALVGAGFVSATASQLITPGNGGSRHSIRALGTVSYSFNLGVSDSYIYAGPELVTVNLDFSGLASGFYDDNFRSLFSTGGSGLVSGSATLTGSTNNINLQRDRETFNVSGGISRMTADPDTNGASTSESRAIALSIVTDPRRTLTVRLELAVAAGVVGPNSARVQSTADASQTLNFASNRPVFEVSDGLIADFAEANIFNNRWVDPRAPVDPISPVPLPAGFPLLLVGLAAFGLMRRA